MEKVANDTQMIMELYGDDSDNDGAGEDVMKTIMTVTIVTYNINVKGPWDVPSCSIRRQ